MQNDTRANVFIQHDLVPIEKIIRELQHAQDEADVDMFNLYFANDILWGSPFGAVIKGYEQIHNIHKKMFASRSINDVIQYEIEHIGFLSDTIAIAYIRKTTDHSKNGKVDFDEVALLVFTYTDGKWWIAAGQHLPDRRDIYKK